MFSAPMNLLKKTLDTPSNSHWSQTSEIIYYFTCEVNRMGIADSVTGKETLDSISVSIILR